MHKKRSTRERRERVRELFGKRDLVIAEILFEEGYVDTPPRCTEERKRELIEGLRRNVCNDRIAIKNEWRSGAQQLTLEDHRIESFEYIARLQTRIYDLERIVESYSGGKGSTAVVNAIAEIRQLEELIAKAKGSAVPTAPPETPGDTKAPTTVVFDFSKCSVETKEELRNDTSTADEPDESDDKPR